MSESDDQAASVTAQTLSGAGFLDRVVGHANGVQSWRWTWRMGLRPDVSCFSTPSSAGWWHRIHRSHRTPFDVGLILGVLSVLARRSEAFCEAHRLASRLGLLEHVATGNGPVQTGGSRFPRKPASGRSS